LVFSVDGLRLYSSSGDQTIRIWDVGERRCLATLRGSNHEVYGLAVSPDGTTLASACKDGVVAFWDARPRPKEEQPRRIELGRFGWPAFAPDSRVLAAPRNGTVSLFDLATLKEIEPIRELGTDVGAVAYSPDGTMLASGGPSGKIRVWSCAERSLLQELGDANDPIYLHSFQAGGTLLLSFGAKGRLIWWNTRTWQPARSYEVELTGAADVSPDGRLAAVGARGTMRWLNAETGELLETTPQPRDLWRPIGRFAFSRDGSRLAGVTEYGSVAIWDPSSFRLIASFRGHMQAAHGVAFSPDGRRLVTGGGSSPDAVKLWDLSVDLSTQAPRELIALRGHGSVFSWVAFSPDGQWLAACGREGGLHLWRAPSWEEIEAEEKKLENRQSP
jgi:WD40 repeat protein